MTTAAEQTVELPAGVKHWTTTATAETWEAWDALTSDDGWKERVWHVDADSKQCDSDMPGARLHQQKTARIRGQRIVVFPPSTPREP